MLAASPGGRLILLSTPYIAAGHFYSIWHGSSDWQRYELPTAKCLRVDPNWLAARRREDPLRYAREYECAFGSPEDALFTAAMLDAMVSRDFARLDL